MNTKQNRLTIKLNLISVILIVLKLTDVLDWSWFWVLSPLWIPVSILFLFLFILLIVWLIVFIYAILKNK